MISFFLYHLATVPWPFFSGPLDYKNSTANPPVGGCEPTYSWCAHTARVPLSVYIASYVVLIGLGFPNMASPLGTLYSQILGPRKQVKYKKRVRGLYI